MVETKPETQIDLTRHGLFVCAFSSRFVFEAFDGKLPYMPKILKYSTLRQIHCELHTATQSQENLPNSQTAEEQQKNPFSYMDNNKHRAIRTRTSTAPNEIR